MDGLDQKDGISRSTRPDAPRQADPEEAVALGATASAGHTDADAQRSRSEILYDRFAEKSREFFEAGHEKGREALDKAMDLAREQLAAAGEFSTEQGEQFKRYLRRDLEQTADDVRWLGQEAQERLHPSRVGAGALSSLAKLMHAAGDAMNTLSRKAVETLTYNTGELTTAGTLTCSACDQKVHLKRTGHVPPCPRCHGTRFRKGY
jgi:Zn finger protein HypA/HybF involved in hydrogenase expression